MLCKLKVYVDFIWTYIFIRGNILFCRIVFTGGKEMIGLIDMHCHILPGVDDGSQSMEQTINMIKIAYEDGIRKMIVTPHYHIGRMIADRNKCQKQLAEVRAEIEKLGMDMELYSGNEIYYFSEAMDKVADKQIETLAQSSYVLLEFEPKVDYQRIQRAVNDVAMEGYVPIIAHIERYMCLVDKPDRGKELISQGALLQVNASSVVGKHGKDIQKFIKKLMKKELIAFVASDAHGDTSRRPRLMEAYEYVKKKHGEAYADDVFCNNQLKVIADDRI